jgi:hypothetical protein
MIGVFDSGLGGLTVLKAFLRSLPQYDYLYLGDNGRAPYGNKSLDVIYEYTRQAVEFLWRMRPHHSMQHSSPAKALQENPADLVAIPLSGQTGAGCGHSAC